MRLILIIISSLLVSSTIAEAQDLELFVVVRDDCIEQGAFDGALHVVNLDSFLTRPLGNIGFNGVTSLEFLGDGRLVGSANNDPPGGGGSDARAILININPASGAGTLIGEIGDRSTGVECGRAPDITYDAATNTLYSTGDACAPVTDDFLQTINQATGKGTRVGTYNPFNGGGNGIAIRDDGVIFVTASEELITVDPQTGAPTKIADIQISVENDDSIFVNGLAFHPVTGELYGTTIDQTDTASEKSSKLIILDTENGNTTIVGDLPNCTDGLVFKQVLRPIPTLSEWGLIAMAGILGIVGFMVMRRRKVTA